MSGAITVAAQRPSNAWRQRGYTDGVAGRPSHPPAGDGDAGAYRVGYRRGAEQRARVTA